jgi:basic membrane lipoprotein Med (substrate-binding protein (PBP1-ABC) superfamily)
MGAIAGAMAENDRLMYLEDYPISGNIAHINAFALGAQMVNPRAKVYLEWTCSRDLDVSKRIQEVNPSCISCRDMVIPDDESRLFGIYHLGDGHMRNLAMPLCHWGRFYEKLIRAIMDGTWKQDDNTQKAINYWWGMSADVVDVICSKNLPSGTKRLVQLLRQCISSGEFYLFSGELRSQDGLVQDENAGELTPEQIMKMDWLAENIIGSIPDLDELTEQARPVILQQGLDGRKG